MKVHCPKCNSVNFLPSTLPSSIISNISCAVCKEMIDVPLTPEVDLPDEDLMDVSSLRDKLDDKGRLLFSDSQKSSETSETVSLESYQLPPLPIEDDIISFEDSETSSDEPLSIVPEDITPLPLQGLDETVDLSYDDFHTNQSDMFQNKPDTETVDSGNTVYFAEPDQIEQESSVGQTEMSFTPEEATQNPEDDIWAQLRRETEELKQTQYQQSPQQPQPKEFGPLLIEEPRKSSGGFKFLLFGFLFLLLLGIGAGAFWIYINLNSNSDNGLSAGKSPTQNNQAPVSANPNPTSTNPTVDNVENGKTSTNKAAENPKNHSNINEGKNADSTSSNVSEQNNNAQANNTSNTQSPENAKRERTVKNTNSSKPPSADANQGEGRFTVQVGSYPNAEGANDRVSQLQSSGFPARVVVANIPRKGTWYRVHVGRFASRDEAERYARELKSKGAAKELFVTDAQ